MNSELLMKSRLLEQYFIYYVYYIRNFLGIHVSENLLELEHTKLLAHKGDAGNQFKLGLMYKNGVHAEGINYIPLNFNTAATWFQKAADQGHQAAQHELGKLYQEGREGQLPQDYEKAVELYKKGEKHGFAPAHTSLGKMYEKGTGIEQDYFKAANQYIKAANQGDKDGKLCHMMLDFSGKNQYQNDSQAAAFYQEDADMGDAYAQYKLAGIHERGIGVIKNGAEAIRLYEEAANKEFVNAQYSLGYIYETGIVADKDYAKAKEWYTKAINNGSKSAQERLNIINNSIEVRYGGDPEMELAEALYKLAIVLEEGKYAAKTAENDAKAISYYEEAADKELPEAQYALGFRYETGLTVDKNYAKAEEWYKRAINNGSKSAQESLEAMNKNKLI